MTDDLNGLDTRITTRGYFERILVEQREALRVAEVEREKAAKEVRDALEQMVSAGDARLTDHVNHQIESVRMALSALTLLLNEKEARATDRFNSADEATKLAQQNAIEASRLAKKEADDRLLAHNGLILKMEKLVDTFPARKELDEGLGRRVAVIEKWQAKLLGAFALAMIFMPAIVGLVVYLLTRHVVPAG